VISDYKKAFEGVPRSWCSLSECIK
jgi:hypothetical protein